MQCSGAVLREGWKSPYAQVLKSRFKDKEQRQKAFAMYQEEARFRNSRQAKFREAKQYDDDGRGEKSYGGLG